MTIKIGVIIPDRNDRPRFLAKCLEIISRQTLQPHFIEVVNDPARTHEKDITWRYRIGYERLTAKGADVILFIENDDWYAPNYIKTMIDRWIMLEKPFMIGTNNTLYYHIKSRKFLKIEHPRHSSAMNMVISGGRWVDWGDDNNVFVDLHLWKKHIGILFDPKENISIGIKHGIGMTGGAAHDKDWKAFKLHDADGSFLKETVGETDFNFYQSI